MSYLFTTSLALAILASVVIAMASFASTYTPARYNNWIAYVLLGVTVVYFLASTGFLVAGLAQGG